MEHDLQDRSNEGNMSVMEMARTIEFEKTNPASSNLGNGFRDIPYCMAGTELS